MNTNLEPVTLTVRSIPCDVIQGKFFALQDLTAEQRTQALIKFRCPPAWDYLYLVSDNSQQVIARQHVRHFTRDELCAIGTH